MKIKKKSKNIYLEESSEENYDENPPLLLTYIDNKDEYYKSEEYGKLVKVDELKSQAEKINTSTAKWMVENFENLRAEWRKKENLSNRFLKKYFSVVAVGVAVPMIVSMGESLPIMKNVVNIGQGLEIWNAGVAIVLITGALTWLVNHCKNEKRYERMEEIVKDLRKFCRDWYTVKDKNGDPVKAIWFLYHNLNFKNEREREDYLRINYRKYNGYFNLEFFDSSGLEVINDYFSYILDIKNKELDSERIRAQSLSKRNKEKNIQLANNTANWW